MIWFYVHVTPNGEGSKNVVAFIFVGDQGREEGRFIVVSVQLLSTFTQTKTYVLINVVKMT